MCVDDPAAFPQGRHPLQSGRTTATATAHPTGSGEHAPRAGHFASRFDSNEIPTCTETNDRIRGARKPMQRTVCGPHRDPMMSSDEPCLVVCSSASRSTYGLTAATALNHSCEPRLRVSAWGRERRRSRVCDRALLARHECLKGEGLSNSRVVGSRDVSQSEQSGMRDPADQTPANRRRHPVRARADPGLMAAASEDRIIKRRWSAWPIGQA